MKEKIKYRYTPKHDMTVWELASIVGYLSEIIDIPNNPAAANLISKLPVNIGRHFEALDDE